jgi:hypothetical protein
VTPSSRVGSDRPAAISMAAPSGPRGRSRRPILAELVPERQFFRARTQCRSGSASPRQSRRYSSSKPGAWECRLPGLAGFPAGSRQKEFAAPASASPRETPTMVRQIAPASGGGARQAMPEMLSARPLSCSHASMWAGYRLAFLVLMVTPAVASGGNHGQPSSMRADRPFWDDRTIPRAVSG